MAITSSVSKGQVNVSKNEIKFSNSNFIGKSKATDPQASAYERRRQKAVFLYPNLQVGLFFMTFQLFP